MTKEIKELKLTPKEIQRQIARAIKKYEKLNFLERFSMYMGVVQLFEISLKNLLVNKCSYDFDKLEKWTLGRTAKELEKNKFRQDFLHLLNNVVEYRNYIAHELLSNEILYRSLTGNKVSKNHYSKGLRQLDKAILELEQLIIIFRWTEENDEWLQL